MGYRSNSRTSDAADLCTSCGLCCNGALFDSVPFPPSETDAVIALGLEPFEEPKGQPRFHQPCLHLKGTMCAVYERRPSSCRAFRCKLLQAIDEGVHTPSSARVIVDEAKAMIERVIPQMDAAGMSVAPRHWGALLKKWQVESRAGRATPEESKTVLQLTLLNRFLDTHFRDPGQQVVKPKE